ALGLGAGLEAAGLRSGAVVLRDGPTGRAVLKMDLKGGDFFLLHRADLIGLLRAGAEAAGVELRLGAGVDDLRETAGGVALGGTGATPLLVAADGVRSQVRPLLNPGSGPAAFSGQVAFRALVRAERPGPAQAVVFMGPKRHLVRYPLRGGSLVNLVGVVEQADWASEGWHEAVAPEVFRAAFAGFTPGLRSDLARVSEVHRWGLFLHPVAPVWHSRRMVLAGDAAHPTLPFLAQGANLALEDAFVLAACLAALPREQALARYQALRRPRVQRAIAAAAANARNYHLANPLVRGVAHTGLRGLNALAPGLMLGRFRWLYGEDVTAVTP
ncbi:FAD-dependent monooxygenase, partial [Oceaniglobus roseus]|uniref:FAD-dependent monooxygenase n=1 Tax=Oceaniglobus roseus TaxID=1737570 RepID=UPI000C7EA009